MACRAAKLRRLLPPIEGLNTPVFKYESTTASILDNMILVVGCKHSYAADLKVSFFICQLFASNVSLFASDVIRLVHGTDGTLLPGYRSKPSILLLLVPRTAMKQPPEGPE
jgi:hypothetical protein